MQVDFKEGDDVKKGDLLAEIDPRPYQAALAQAKGNLARDQALLKGAQVDLARYQGLVAQNAVPRQTLDTQVALVAQDQGTVEADRAAVNAAQVNLNIATSCRRSTAGSACARSTRAITSRPAMPTASS